VFHILRCLANSTQMLATYADAKRLTSLHAQAKRGNAEPAVGLVSAPSSP